MMNNHGESSSSSSSDENGEMEPKLKRARWDFEAKRYVKYIPNEDGSSDDDCEENSRIVYPFTPLKICCREAILSTTESIFDRCGSSSQQDVEMNNESLDPEEVDEMNQDSYRFQWHNRQMARCYIDNKINSSLEAFFGCGVTHLEQDVDISDIVEEIHNDTVEVDDEGITMAIELHGLKTNNNLQEGEASDSTETNAGTSTSDLKLPNSNSEPTASKDYMEVNSNEFLDKAVAVAIFEKGLLNPNQ